MNPTAISIVLLISIVLGLMSTYVVQEGHVGIVYKGGRIEKGILEPGRHFKSPFFTSIHEVQITVQTDEVRDIAVNETA